ncbi:MAG: ornithine--oxo-acid transaminase [Alphaproteobacteria bacterium]
MFNINDSTHDAQYLIDKESEVCAHNYHPIPVVLSHGKGSWLWDVMGGRYLDMMSAYSAVSLGHCNPKLTRALYDQANKLCVPSRAFHTDKLPRFLEKLCQVSGMDVALPMNTGAEAVETAIKAARRWGYQVKGIPANKAEIIVADENFHGRTTTIVGFSSDEESRKDFGPYSGGFPAVPFGDAAAIEAAINANTAAVMIEPIQGEAGIIIPPDGYLKEVQQICQKHNVLFILDEVQSGMGRTGKWFAFEHEDAKPDGLILGKALGGGVLAVSAFLARKDVMDVFVPGSHGSTFGGNPLSAAVGLSTIMLMEEENLVARSARQGNFLMEQLEALNHPMISEIRGRGLWVGVDLKVNGRKFCELLAGREVLTKETREKTVRLAPPFVVTQDELRWAVTMIGETLDEMS